MSWLLSNTVGILAVMIIILGAVIDQLIRVVSRADSEYMRDMSDEALHSPSLNVELKDR